MRVILCISLALAVLAISMHELVAQAGPALGIGTKEALANRKIAGTLEVKEFQGLDEPTGITVSWTSSIEDITI